MALLVLGYLLSGRGSALRRIFAITLALHRAVGAGRWLCVQWLDHRRGVLAIAGAFQFSRAEISLPRQVPHAVQLRAEHWRGRARGAAAFRLGVHHGLFCVGCCWAIMLLMFVVGTGSVGWMLGLGAVMAIEKNAPWGRSLSRPLGGGLLAAAGLVAAANLLA